MYLIFIAFIGLAFGSFLSVILFRLDEKAGIWTGRSECPHCLTRLRWVDLIPILSFLFLRGKCRYCSHKIRVLYPVMELVMAGVFLLYFVVSGLYFDIRVVYELSLIFFLMALIFFDYIYYILPDKIIIIAFGISLLYTLIFQKDLIIGDLAVGLGLASFFGIIYLVSRGEWMGFGDVKLAFLIGFILGYPVAIMSIIVAVWSGAIWGLALMAAGKANPKTALPFGTFISAVAILFIIFKDHVQIPFFQL